MDTASRPSRVASQAVIVGCRCLSSSFPLELDIPNYLIQFPATCILERYARSCAQQSACINRGFVANLRFITAQDVPAIPN